MIDFYVDYKSEILCNREKLFIWTPVRYLIFELYCLQNLMYGGPWAVMNYMSW